MNSDMFSKPLNGNNPRIFKVIFSSEYIFDVSLLFSQKCTAMKICS